MPSASLQSPATPRTGPLARQTIPVATADTSLLGRVIDGQGRPIDGRGRIPVTRLRPIACRAPDAPSRAIPRQVATGVRVVDGLLPCSCGQRIAIVQEPETSAGRLMAAICRRTSADASVIAVIGASGRETRQFVEAELGPEGLKRCVVVVSGIDEPPAAHVRAILTAVRVAERMRWEGLDALMLVDSSGACAVVPPPELLDCAGERHGGSLTLFYQAAIGRFPPPHGTIWLSRVLAERGHNPPIDVLRSAAGAPGVVDAAHARAIRSVLAALVDYEAIEERLNTGEYTPGATLAGEVAVKTRQAVLRYLQQPAHSATTLEEARTQLLDLERDINERRLSLTGVQPAPVCVLGRPVRRLAG